MPDSISLPSPIGHLTVIADADAVVAIFFDVEHPGSPPDANDRAAASLAGAVTPVDLGENPVLDRAAVQLDEYFRGTRTEFDLPIAPRGTAFQQQAWGALCTIPFGETISYGEQARRLGDKNKSRAVGAANGKNPIPIVVPCHRVVGSNGHLTGFAGGIEVKAWLLDHELRVRAG